MPISPIKEQKKQKYLLLILLVIIIIIAGVIWWGFFKKEKPLVVTPPPFWKPVEINFNVLEDPLLKELKIFEKIPAFEDQAGRENPFLSF